MSYGLSRDVIKWLQSLDLTWQLKTPKWEISNGYLVAEIFSWYYPREIEMHMFYNSHSLENKKKNWSLLRNFFKKHNFEIPEAFIDGTIHCRQEASSLLLAKIYECLTNRPIPGPGDGKLDFTDMKYQKSLPAHARATAGMFIRSNLKTTEIMEQPNILTNQFKAHRLIYAHAERRKHERDTDPERYDRRPTLGELAKRCAPAEQSEVIQKPLESDEFAALFSDGEAEY